MNRIDAAFRRARAAKAAAFMPFLTAGDPDLETTAAIIEEVSPIPFAAIHSTHDEFVPVDEVRKVIQFAREPKKLWIVKASNHRFSDNEAEFNQRLLEAIAWVKQNLPR